MIDRARLFMCVIASEIGFRFEGVGTEYSNKLVDALGVPVTIVERAQYDDTFAELAKKYSLSHRSNSAFSVHFSIISWPTANALLHLDLLGPITRLLARAPATSLPGPEPTANFASLVAGQAWQKVHASSNSFGSKPRPSGC